MLPLEYAVHEPDTGQLSALEDWLDTDFGRHVLTTERALLADLLPRLFGFHLMQIGMSRRVPLHEHSVIRHRFQLTRMPAAPGVSAVSVPEALPFEPDSIDVALLHHTLEFSPDPHQMLRETARVLVPHGHLLVFGFNPWSLFGLSSLPGRYLGHPVWRSRLLGVRRVADWLQLLGFEVDSVQYRVFAPPTQRPGVLARVGSVERLGERLALPVGSVYLIHALKEQSGITPVRNLRWRAPRLSAVSLARPAARNRTLH